jgi:hypothetical protein
LHCIIIILPDEIAKYHLPISSFKNRLLLSKQDHVNVQKIWKCRIILNDHTSLNRHYDPCIGSWVLAIIHKNDRSRRAIGFTGATLDAELDIDVALSFPFGNGVVLAA